MCNGFLLSLKSGVRAKPLTIQITPIFSRNMIRISKLIKSSELQDKKEQSKILVTRRSTVRRFMAQPLHRFVGSYFFV